MFGLNKCFQLHVERENPTKQHVWKTYIMLSCVHPLSRRNVIVNPRVEQQTDDNEPIQRQLSPRFAMPQRGKGKVKISPLVGAAFSSNWILFRKVYDTYEEWTGRHWFRENVRAP